MTDVLSRSCAATFDVKVGGSSLSRAESASLIQAEIETHLRLPAMCLLTFACPPEGGEALAWLEGKVAIGKEVLVKSADLGDGREGDPQTLFDGEVVGLERTYDCDNPGDFLTVRCYDRLHRLYRGRKTRTWTNATYSSVVEAVANEGKLTAEVEPSGAQFPVLLQHNESTGALLERFAAECGHLLWVEGTKLYFSPPPTSTGGPSRGSYGRSGPRELMAGDDLQRVSVALSSDLLTDKVEVRGWDPQRKQKTMGTANLSDVADVAAAGTGIDPTQVLSSFGATTFLANAFPTLRADEQNRAAKSIATNIASSFVKLRGELVANPNLAAGRVVSIGGMGKFDGTYLLTQVRHLLVEGAFDTTQIACEGIGDTGGPGGEDDIGGRPQASVLANPMPNVMPGIVCDATDPEKLGRVQVMFSQLGDNIVTDWLRVVSVGAGPNRGFQVIPEANDEVLVVFEQGDFRRGYVLGGMWNGVDKPVHGDVSKRTWRSRLGHILEFDDSGGSPGILLKTTGLGGGGEDPTKNLSVTFDDTATTIVIDSGDGQVKMTLDGAGGNLTIETGASVAVTAKGDLALKGNNIKIEAQANLELKALSAATLEGTASVEVKGAAAKVTGQATLDLSASGNTTLKGLMVLINSS